MTATPSYKRHPFSAAFGDMDPHTFDELGTDMAATDYETSDRQPDVTLFEDMVLDGWHRYLWCVKLAIAPAFHVFKGDRDDAWQYVRQENRLRRQLSQTQRAAMYIQDVDFEDANMTVAEHAARCGVSKRTYEQVRAGIEAGYADELMRGDLTAEQAYNLARQVEAPSKRRRTKAARLEAERDSARAEARKKSEEIGHLQHEILVLNTRIDNITEGKPLDIDESELVAVKSRLASVERDNAIMSAANGRMRAHLLAISDLVAVSDEPVTEQDLAALARQYRPTEVQMEAFTQEEDTT